ERDTGSVEVSGSSPLYSTTYADNQQFTSTTPNFTPTSVEIGCFYVSLTSPRATESDHAIVKIIMLDITCDTPLAFFLNYRKFCDSWKVCQFFL
ncbi:hypothetical protein, partial [uncultured Duncaniella sp.]|uniref:hypothetical protein n=1 Tax=uncultured Duncaniella sp. TaxID=2768039 RepID=UPI00272AE081